MQVFYIKIKMPCKYRFYATWGNSEAFLKQNCEQIWTQSSMVVYRRLHVYTQYAIVDDISTFMKERESAW